MDATTNAPFYDKTSTLERQRSFINGDFVSSSSGETFQTRHPGTGHVICDVEIADERVVDAAVASARTAFAAWSETPAAERGAILRRAAALLRKKSGACGTGDLDSGKAIQETSVIDIISGVEVLEYYGASRTQGSHIDLPSRPSPWWKLERAAIGAWNYPIQIALWKSAPALACGNTMVFKPSEVTPLTALKLAEIYREAGLPEGVFNVVLGAGETGSALVQHPDVAKVSLTGSVATGKRVAAMARALMTLELVVNRPIDF